MSIKLMAAIWENGPDKQAERFVLLALADFANDAGECWPSIASIAAKTCLSERGVRLIIRALEADGWVKTRRNTGRGGVNTYLITTPDKADSTCEIFQKPYGIDRLAILRRDNFTCVYCGYVGVSSGHEIGIDLQVDHVVPRALGGGDEPSNLVCACAKCNNSKRAKTPAEWAKRGKDIPGKDIPGKDIPRNETTETRHLTAQNPERGAPEPSGTIKNHQSDARVQRFDEFWEAYPHRGGTKKGRKPAFEKYRTAVKRGISEQAIIDGAKRSVSDPTVKGGFARDPATWLNQEGWTDEIPTSPATSPAKGQSDRDAKLARYAKIAGGTP